MKYFNETFNQKEKFGGITQTYKQMEGFGEAIEDCGLSDLGFNGLYKWCNNKEGTVYRKEHLNRALGKTTWLNTVPHTKVNV